MIYLKTAIMFFQRINRSEKGHFWWGKERVSWMTCQEGFKVKEIVIYSTWARIIPASIWLWTIWWPHAKKKQRVAIEENRTNKSRNLIQKIIFFVNPLHIIKIKKNKKVNLQNRSSSEKKEPKRIWYHYYSLNVFKVIDIYKQLISNWIMHKKK